MRRRTHRSGVKSSDVFALRSRVRLQSKLEKLELIMRHTRSLQSTSESSVSSSGLVVPGEVELLEPFTPFQVIPLRVSVEQSNETRALEGGVSVEGSIFRVTQSYYVESAEKGVMSFEIQNDSGEWISVDVIRRNGVDSTGRIPNGESYGFTQDITQFYDADFQYRVIRWRPGLFRIPGSGGGQIFFQVPQSAGSGVLAFTVVG